MEKMDQKATTEAPFNIVSIECLSHFKDFNLIETSSDMEW